MINEQRPTPSDVYKKSFAPKELTLKDDLTQFWATFRRNNGLTFEDSGREKRIVSIQADATLAEIEHSKTNFFGIKEGDKIVATGKLDIIQNEDGNTHGYLSFLSVDENFRGEGLAKKLTDIRIQKAREVGCTFVDIDVYTENPIGLATKFNDNFVLTGVDFSQDGESEKQAGKFRLSKKIDGVSEYDSKKGVVENLEEVDLTELDKIKNLLDKDWVGIDIKNIGDPKDNNPENWILIFEKK